MEASLRRKHDGSFNHGRRVSTGNSARYTDRSMRAHVAAIERIVCDGWRIPGDIWAPRRPCAVAGDSGRRGSISAM